MRHAGASKCDTHRLPCEAGIRIRQSNTKRRLEESRAANEGQRARVPAERDPTRDRPPTTHPPMCRILLAPLRFSFPLFYPWHEYRVRG